MKCNSQESDHVALGMGYHDAENASHQHSKTELKEH